MSIGEPGTAPPVTREPESTDQQDARRRRRPWMLAAGSGVAAVALAAGLTAALHKPHPGVPPRSAVTSALTRTAAQSYTFSLDTTVRSQQKELNSDLVSGAYDPRRRLGTELLTAHVVGGAKRAQSRFIGAYVYTSVTPASGFGKLWDKSSLAAAMAAGLPPGDPYGFVSDHPVSPAELDVVLRSAGTAVYDSGSASGPGWTGTSYAFTASLAEGQDSVRGTVDVDRQGRVRWMTTTSKDRGRVGGKVFTTTVRDIKFGDFGTSVRVAMPPASQVKETSGTPYWGFYF